MDPVNHPRRLDVVGIVNLGPGADRLGKLFIVTRPELKERNTNEECIGKVDLVQPIAEVVAAEGHDRSRCRDVLLQLFLEAGQFRVSAESLSTSVPAFSIAANESNPSKYSTCGELVTACRASQ